MGNLKQWSEDSSVCTLLLIGEEGGDPDSGELSDECKTDPQGVGD